MLRTALAVAAGAAVVAAGCGGSSNKQATLFSYNASRPLSYVDRGRVNHGYPIVIHNVSFISSGERVDGLLALPPIGKRLPAVVYIDGTGTDRTALIIEATWLAARGAIALTLTAPSAIAPNETGLSPVAELERQRELTVRDVIAVRRAVDLLQRLPRVDAKRIGYTGLSAGARLGAILAGVEPRLRALVLISAGSPPVSQYVAQAPKSIKADVGRILGEIDPLASIRNARPGSLLLVDGLRDGVVPRAALKAIVAAAPKGTTVRWFDTGHVPGPAAWRAQLAWISTKLGVDGPRVTGARTGP